MKGPGYRESRELGNKLVSAGWTRPQYSDRASRKQVQEQEVIGCEQKRPYVGSQAPWARSRQT